MSTDPSKIPAARKNVVIPHLIVSDASSALAFYERAFGASVVSKQLLPDKRVMHSEVQVFASTFFVVDDFPEWREMKESTPLALGGTACCYHFCVDDVDGVVRKAEAAGATVKMPPEDQFWGDRYAKVVDPFGHDWSFSTPLKGGPESWPKRSMEPETKKAK